MKKRERQSNIELLRVLAIMGVIVLHYNNPVMGGGYFVCKGREFEFLFVVFPGIFICL